MLVLEPKRLDKRILKLQQINKKLLMNNDVLYIHQFIINEAWNFDLDSKYIKTKKIKIANAIIELNHVPNWLKGIEILIVR